jgi:hypothetical protein
MNPLVVRDEREHAVDLAADRLAFLVVCYGALVIAAWRSFALGLESWDLLGLVVLGGVTGLGYRLWQRAVTRPWALVILATILVAAVLAIAVALFAETAKGG